MAHARKYFQSANSLPFREGGEDTSEWVPHPQIIHDVLNKPTQRIESELCPGGVLFQS